MINEKINRYENNTNHKSITSVNVKLENQNNNQPTNDPISNLLLYLYILFRKYTKVPPEYPNN